MNIRYFLLGVLLIFLLSYCVQQTPCAKEGESIPIVESMPICCPGLEEIYPKDPNEEGIYGICTAKCDNGICDNETETYYNCPKDCSKPIKTCAQTGGECAEDKCSGIHFEIGSPVSDCPGRCCVCCKQIIPECVPGQCCHPTSCVLKQMAPNCSGVMCSEECMKGTMDCDAGYCELDKTAAKCYIVWR